MDTSHGLNKLTDEELRTRLIQFGFPNIPITDTTRKTLIKKLKNHIKNKGNQLRQTSSNAAQYSSAEGKNRWASIKH
jgi:membrane protein Man1